MNARLFTFAGVREGPWRILSAHAVTGPPLPSAACLDVSAGTPPEATSPVSWILRGITSNERYVHRAEKSELTALSPALGRPEAGAAALIAIRKSPAWWAMTQDERRRVLEEQSHHIQIGLRHTAAAAIARRLHHCRDLGDNEPFDFVTWFEFNEASSACFDALVAELRATPEWRYVDREVDLRLARSAHSPPRVLASPS